MTSYTAAWTGIPQVIDDYQLQKNGVALPTQKDHQPSPLPPEKPKAALPPEKPKCVPAATATVTLGVTTMTKSALAGVQNRAKIPSDAIYIPIQRKVTRPQNKDLSMHPYIVGSVSNCVLPSTSPWDYQYDVTSYF